MSAEGDDQRLRILQFLLQNEGINLGGIIRGLQLGNHQAAHHLRILEEERRIWSRKDGRLLRYYTSAIHVQTPIAQLPAPPLPQDPNSVLIQLLDRLARTPEGGAMGPPTQGQLALELGCSQQLISYHLKTLTDGGLVIAVQDGVRKIWQVTPTGFNLLAENR